MEPHTEKDTTGVAQQDPAYTEVVAPHEKHVDSVDHQHDEYAHAHDLKKVATTATLAVDLENRDAVKGDDSDGQVDWSFKQIVATVCLSGLYVGMSSIAKCHSLTLNAC
jgi:hypothetical protein